MRYLIPLVLLVALAGCRREESPPPTPPPAETVVEVELPTFLEDDYPAALAEAREKGRLLFVDTWAPWCHSCLSMKRTVYRDERLAAMRERFVWVSLNTEKTENAAFLERYPQKVWPTLTLIDPTSEEPVVRWMGSLTIEELLPLLEDALAAAKAEGPDAALAEANRLQAAGDAGSAVQALEKALAEAPATWPNRSRAVLHLLSAQRYGLRQMEPCFARAEKELAVLPRSATWAKIAAMGLRCAVDLPASPERGERVRAMETRVREALGPPLIEMNPDDRSNLYEVLANARRRSGDDEGARSVAERWLTYLEEEAAAARDADVRAVFDSHRLVASLLLQSPERVVEALQASERAAPDDYNPPSRLAIVYHRLGKLKEALAASGRALERVYGPRKMRVLNDRGDILLSMGEQEQARAAFAEVLEWAEKLPEGQRPSWEVDRARSRLESLGSASE